MTSFRVWTRAVSTTGILTMNTTLWSANLFSLFTMKLWEERMRLDFFKDNWYDDYMEIRERLYNNHSRYECFLFHDVGTSKRSWRRSGKSEFISVGSLCRSKGYSRFITTKNFAFVSNACVHVRNGQVTLHMKSDRQLNLLLSDYKWKDFYCTCKSRDSM